MRKTHLVLVGLLLSFTLNATNDIPRPEYPRPQFERAEWINLNGTWTYEFDFSNSGKNRQLTTVKQLGKTITVPFCPESKLSGVNHTDFIEQMWYQRSISIPESWKDKKILLNFGAVDYHAEIYIDGNYLGNHDGGSSSFSLDITPAVKPGNTHSLVVLVVDKTRSGLQAVGKQSTQFNSYGCFYTRVTGIWQTVWMEAVSPYGLRSARTNPDIDQQQLIITPEFYRPSNNQTLEITLYDKSRQIGCKVVKCNNGSSVVLPVKNMKLWSPESPYLYDIIYRIKNAKGEVIDEVKSYVGMRKVHTSDGQIYLNNEPYYQRLILNQGYYPDGIWTAPTDEALKNDILLSKEAGFNGARLHQKVFEERFHYWADKLGFITWGESANWGMDHKEEEAARYFLTEWSEILMRDCNHPSIIAWVPFNQPLENPYELIAGNMPRLIIDSYRLTKSIDPTRLVNGIAGDIHFLTDIWGVRNYESNAKDFARYLKPNEKQAFYNHQPFFIGEFGGMLWTGNNKDKTAWGYGKTITSEEVFYERLEGFIDAIANSKEITGFCYTQLTDIEQEKNGIYYYDRRPKLDMKRIKSIFGKIPSNRSWEIKE